MTSYYKITFFVLIFSGVFNSAFAKEFPNSFFGVQVDVRYDSLEKIPILVTNKYVGPFGVLSGESIFKPKNKLPMFPTFSKNKEEAYNYVIHIIDVTGKTKPAKIIPLVVGWKIRKPFKNGSYSYITKMVDICNMFKEDLKDVADPALPHISDKNIFLYETIKIKLQSNKTSVCTFFPTTPIEERNKLYKSYLEYVNDNKRIAIRYDIKPLYKGGKLYEELYVNYEVSKNKGFKYFKELKLAMDEINKKIAKEKADINRPY